jgi:hypothetical protein
MLLYGKMVSFNLGRAGELLGRIIGVGPIAGVQYIDVVTIYEGQRKVYMIAPTSITGIQD